MRILLKFIEPEHLSDFLNGNLFFKRTGYFTNLEREKGDKVIGDKYEGSHFRHIDVENEKLFIEIDGEFIPLKIKNGFHTIRYEAADDFQLACFVELKQDEDFNTEDNKLFQIKEDVVENLKRDFAGRKVVAIHNEKAFFQSLNENAAKMNLGIYHGPVKYFDPKNETPLTKEEFEQNMIMAFFHKRNSYQNQKEYRIITEQPVKKDFIKIRIDNLKDYVHAFDIEELIHLNLFIEEEQLS
ncbi:hypothetical protein MOC76_12565 [Bacillus spizizenii]|nr:hypothetical protein [Bacillus spizizenii]MCY9244015.1 hypothetical protein [Bacillus spizizenii]MCY9326436.1 hypothetical protein [Bacillus spizizenii]